jgi:hypothetical protein
MSTPTRAFSVQAYNLVLYKRALHPELFQMKARRALRHADFDLEAWIMPGSHLLRFQQGSFCACELVTEKQDGLPTLGTVATFPCAGEKDYEHVFSEAGGVGEGGAGKAWAGVRYITAVQTESLSENLFDATYGDMVELIAETNALHYKWETEALGRCMSILDLQRYPNELHAQAYHLIGAGGLVLRSQTIFEVR